MFIMQNIIGCTVTFKTWKLTLIFFFNSIFAFASMQCGGINKEWKEIKISLIINYRILPLQ